MPESCCFVGCRNRRCKGSGKRFFRVPADPVQRQRWIAATNRKHWVPTVYTRQISSVRIHVERVIGLLRNKYRIIQGTLPISLIKRPSESTPTIDKILLVCAGLTNLSKSIV